jgi:hypothetical protein
MSIARNFQAGEAEENQGLLLTMDMVGTKNNANSRERVKPSEEVIFFCVQTCNRFYGT